MPDKHSKSPAQPSAAPPICTSVLSLLACPVCHGELRLECASLICAGCARTYPITDGIPTLIAEHAVKE